MPSEDPCESCITRRNFLLLTLSAAAATGCQSVGTHGTATHVIDAGPATAYARDGLYPNFRDLGFFIIRRGGKLEAMSSICPHRGCKVDSEEDHTFYCPCHGSTFAADGHVTEGPATRDLPILTTSVAGNGHLLVSVPA